MQDERGKQQSRESVRLLAIDLGVRPSEATLAPLPARGKRPPATEQELKQRICERVAEGERLTTVLRTPGYPCLRTIWYWRTKDATFDHDLVTALQLLAVQLNDQALDTVDLAKTDPVNYNAYRLIAEKYQWASSKFYPKMFGEHRERQPHTQVNVAVGLVLPEADRVKLLERHERALLQNMKQVTPASE